MRYMFHVLFLFISACVQGTLCDMGSIAGVAPNIFIIYTSIICFLAYKYEGIIVAGVFGFILDIITVKFIGIYTVLFMIAAFFVSTLSEKVFKEPKFYISMILTFIVSVFINFFYYLISFLILGGLNLVFALKVIFIEAFYNSIFTVILYFIIKHITRNFYADKGEYIE